MSYDIYSTHHCVMADLVARSTGPVLECGMGFGSTPMLHRLCAGMKRHLLSCETVPDWAQKFKSLMVGLHSMAVVAQPWSEFQLIETMAPWAVAFVDNAPGETRIELIRRLKGKAKWIVAHDSERDYGTGANYGYERVKPLFKYVSEYRFLRPYTLVLSDDEPYELDAAEQIWTPDAAQQKYFDEKGLKA